MNPETLDQITAIFGWMTVINIAFMSIAALFVALKRDWLIDIHGKMLGVEREALPRLYFTYLGNYKLLLIHLSLVPWIALQIVG